MCLHHHTCSSFLKAKDYKRCNIRNLVEIFRIKFLFRALAADYSPLNLSTVHYRRKRMHDSTEKKFTFRSAFFFSNGKRLSSPFSL